MEFVPHSSQHQYQHSSGRPQLSEQTPLTEQDSHLDLRVPRRPRGQLVSPSNMCPCTFLTLHVSGNPAGLWLGTAALPTGCVRASLLPVHGPFPQEGSKWERQLEAQPTRATHGGQGLELVQGSIRVLQESHCAKPVMEKGHVPPATSRRSTCW